MKWIAFVALSCLPIIWGCSRESGNNSKSSTPESQRKSDSENRQTASVVRASTSDNGTSPAAASQNALGADSSPEEVCQAFLSALQSGDNVLAQQQLTRQALVETQKAQLILQAPGAPGATYTVQPAQFATSKQQVAQVDCLVSDGNEEPMTLTWLLRRNASGWKISGMMVHVEGNQLDLLSFENPLDVARIQQSVSDTSVETRQATLKTKGGALK